MNAWLFAAGSLILIGCGIHSFLGEVLFLRRTPAEALPTSIFGGHRASKAMMRASWHLLSLTWLTMGAALMFFSVSVHDPAVHVFSIPVAIAFSGATLYVTATALVTDLRALIRHPAGILFVAITVLTWRGSA